MKINPVNRYFVKNFIPITGIWGATTVIMGLTYPAASYNSSIQKEEFKTEVRTKAPEHYKRALAAEPEERFFIPNVGYWAREVNKMSDSIAAKNAYNKE